MKFAKVIRSLFILIAVLFLIAYVVGYILIGSNNDNLLETIEYNPGQLIDGAAKDTQGPEQSLEQEHNGNYPEIQAEAAITVDADSGEILFSKSKNKKMFPASLTKLMTALILAEEMDKQDVLIYSQKAKEQEANKLDFPEGSAITAENAIQGMLVFSANDFAYMIGENISGSSDKFAKLMNKKAIQLGLKNTHFVNACGLHDDNHYTTAYDLSLLAKEIYKNKWIMNITGMESAHIKTTDGKGMIVYNTNTLLGKTGCIGGKTGYTSQAGKCLVAYYKKDNRVIIGIVLNAPDDTVLSDNMRKIVDWSFKK